MEEDQNHHHLLHTCKFCGKNFPCGRSLGGHMRSHLMSISTSNPPQKCNQKLPRKKKIENRFSKANEASKLKEEEDALLEENLCKECGRSFQSVKALFGHMKCHSVNNGRASEIFDTQSDNEGAAAAAADRSCGRRRKRKRSGSGSRARRYNSNTNSSSLSYANFPSEIEQQEQEEVALSLIILSRDKGDWSRLSNNNTSVVESSGNSSQLLEISRISDRIKAGQVRVDVMKLKPEVNQKGSTESEVDSPRNNINNLIRERKSKARKRKKKSIDVPKKLSSFYSDENLQDSDKKSKFTCSICKKGFPSYQALGGHRASHKKFKGTCAPRSETSLETQGSPGISDQNLNEWTNKQKVHECPICSRVFPSGQALGGHKRSHLVADQAKSLGHPPVEPVVQEIRHFLDLNLPAPNEEEQEFKPWWIAASSSGREHEPLLGLLSS